MRGLQLLGYFDAWKFMDQELKECKRDEIDWLGGAVSLNSAALCAGASVCDRGIVMVQPLSLRVTCSVETCCQ